MTTTVSSNIYDDDGLRLRTDSFSEIAPLTQFSYRVIAVRATGRSNPSAEASTDSERQLPADGLVTVTDVWRTGARVRVDMTGTGLTSDHAKHHLALSPPKQQRENRLLSVSIGATGWGHHTCLPDAPEVVRPTTVTYGRVEFNTGAMNRARTQRIPSDTASLSFNEGGSKSYWMRLKAAPDTDVVIDIAPRAGSDTDVSVSPSSLTFTASNGRDWQKVTATADRDGDSDDDIVVVTHKRRSGIDGFTVADVTLTVNDVFGVTVTPTRLAIQDNTSKTYTVTLSEQPASGTNVTIKVGLTGTKIKFSGGGILVFTSANWSVPKTVTLTASAGASGSTNPAVTFTHTVTSSGNQYDNLVIDSVTAIAYAQDPPPDYHANQDASEDALNEGCTHTDDAYVTVSGLAPGTTYTAEALFRLVSEEEYIGGEGAGVKAENFIPTWDGGFYPGGIWSPAHLVGTVTFTTDP